MERRQAQSLAGNEGGPPGKRKARETGCGYRPVGGLGPGLQRLAASFHSSPNTPQGEAGSHPVRRRKSPCGCSRRRGEESTLDVPQPAVRTGVLQTHDPGDSQGHSPPTQKPETRPDGALAGCAEGQEGKSQRVCTISTVGLCNTHAQHKCKHANRTGERPGGGGSQHLEAEFCASCTDKTVTKPPEERSKLPEASG